MTRPFAVVALGARDPRDVAGWLAMLERAIEATARPAEITFAISDRCLELQEALAARQQARARIGIVTLTHWYDEVAAVQAALRCTRAPLVVTIRVGASVTGKHLEHLLGALDRGADVALPATRHPLLDKLSLRLFGGSPGSAGRHLRACHRSALERLADRSVAFPLLDWYALWQGLRVVQVALDGHHSVCGGPLSGAASALSLLFLHTLLDFAKRPLRLFGLAGTAALGLGLAITLPPVLERLVHARPLADDPVLLPGLLLTALGLQSAVLGLLAELLVFMRSRALSDGETRPVGD